MIVIKLIGGLGNQMFQYACGKTLALKNNTSLKLDISQLLDRSHNLHTHRIYELGVFDIKDEIATKQQIDKFGNKSFSQKILKKVFSINRYKVIHEETFFYNDQLQNEKPNLCLIGYWQSEQYFTPYETEIRKSFSFREEASPENKKILQQIKDTNSVSIHFRRGDYVSLKSASEVHGTCSLDYYNSAIEIIADKESNPFFFIFSDEPEWVKENFEIDFPSLIISHNTGKNSFEDLRLMSACKHNIIANSSFSWWGAWLNQNKDKTVIAPKRWFLDSSLDTKDLLPKRWIKI